MSKRDYIDLIKVAEAIMRLERACVCMTGCTFDEGECYEVYFLWEVLRRNASENYHYSDDLDADVDNYKLFSEIISSTEMSLEQKYEALMH